MGLETGTYIDDLVAANPPGTDPKSQGDDHIRLIKTVLLATFPQFTGPLDIAHDQVASLQDVINAAFETVLPAQGTIPWRSAVTDGAGNATFGVGRSASTRMHLYRNL